MQTSIRLSALISSSSPLSQSRSLSNVLEVQDDVVDRRWSWSSVMERDELVGRMSLVSRLPQYWWPQSTTGRENDVAGERREGGSLGEQ